MRDTLRSRVRRFFGAGAHGLVGVLEALAPEQVLREAMREADLGIEALRRELSRRAVDRCLTRSQLQAQQRAHAELDSQIGVAIACQRDDLATSAIARQLEAEAECEQLTERLAAADAEVVDLDRYLHAMLERRSMTRIEVEAFLAVRREAAEEPHDERRALHALASCERVCTPEGALAIERRELRDELRHLELTQLTREHAIEARLAARKAAPGLPSGT
jgi:phage shock protein A